MKQFLRRAGALALAFAVTASAASASVALGWNLHTASLPISQGTALDKTIFWSDTYSDLRREFCVEYTPNPDVMPTVAYGDKVLTKATLTEMAASLESQGKRVVSGLNGDWYVVSTGSTTGLLVTDGILRATPYYTTAWAIGFNADGTAFIGQPGLTTTVTFGGETFPLTGAINKVRQISNGGIGGLTLLTSDFAATTQNTQAGVDVVLVPMDDGSGSALLTPTIGGQVTYAVEQVLESTGSVAIPEGKAILTLNAQDNADLLAKLRALQPGDPVTLSITTADSRWEGAVQALGGTRKIVTDGKVESIPTADDTRSAWSAVGVKADGTVVFYAIDGRQSSYSVGATITQVASRLVELGCVDALLMDGGGSTTIGVTYPGGSALEVINKPSDGKQRKNSTAIFLTSQLQATGYLGSYMVSPWDAILLSGATVSLTASGLDTSYYPTAGNPVSWSVTGGGTVDENGVFTAGSESGSSQVTASDGTASGSAWITTVKTPDSISLSNEATGAAITSLALDPGAQVDLKASAVYRKLALTAQDTCFTWQLDPAVGTIDANGVLTAGDKSASGNLTVSAGGKSVTIPVSVAGHILTLEDFESGLTTFANTDSATAVLESDLTRVHNGRQSLQVSYDTSAAGTATLTAGLNIPTGESWLGVWVYGDGSGNTLMATAQDVNGVASQFLLTALDFTGWKYITAQLPDNAARIIGLNVIYGGGEGAQQGTLWLDQFTTANEQLTDTTAPTISLKVSGTQVTATVSDDLDRAIDQAKLSLTYDGQALAFTWNQGTGQLTATLPAADSGYHRLTLTACDASGNLARASADILPATERVAPFTDTAGHWCESYATFLYDQGISQGTGGEVPMYQPDKSITRAEFFTMTARWMGLDLSAYSGVELPFADADSIPAWALDAVKAMYSLGILQGSTGEGGLVVNANSTITRAEAFTILGRTQAMGYAQAELTFTDADQVPDWALPYVQRLVGQGIVSGSDGLIRPSGLLTRAEVAKLLYAML